MKKDLQSADLTSHEVKHNLHGWMVSYADMITLLLCFFILFFKIEDTSKDPGVTKQQLVALLGFVSGTSSSNTEKPKDVSPAGSKPTEPTAADPALKQPNAGSGVVNLDLDSNTYLAAIFPAGLPADLLTALGTSSSPAKVSNNQKDIFIEFPKREFFARGSDFLTAEGEDSVRKLLKVISRYDQEIFIEIEGYSDTSPVQRKDSRYADNMGLSLLRAMRVYNFMVQSGIDKKSLSVIGHGEHRPFDRSGNIIEESASQFQRRVTFRIEARKP